MFHFDLIGLELSNGNLILYSVETFISLQMVQFFCSDVLFFRNFFVA